MVGEAERLESETAPGSRCWKLGFGNGSWGRSTGGTSKLFNESRRDKTCPCRLPKLTTVVHT